MSVSEYLSEYLKENRERQLEELFEFLRIPSVSSDPERSGDMLGAAEHLRGAMEASGLEARLLPSRGQPLVYAEYLAAPDLPTVLVYGHYDVQPAQPLDAWVSPPFEPTLTNGAIVARGAMDNKGQLFAHVKGAEALLRASGSLPVNLKFVVEGEEEIGSPSLAAAIDENRELLAADVLLVSDGAMIAPETPTITYGHRGLAYLEVHAKGAGSDLHSGTFGGAVPNPLNALGRLIGLLHDEQGRVAVPGFYDSVAEPSLEERDALARVPFDEAEFAREAESSATPGEAGYSVLERLWLRPTLDVNGLAGGHQGDGAKTVIAARGMMKLSCRLVPNQTHGEIERKVAEFLRANAPDGIDIEPKVLEGSNPFVLPTGSPSAKAAASALESVYGRPPVFARSGGSLPVVEHIAGRLGIEPVLVGLGLESDRIHAPNEKFDLVNFYRGIEVSASLLDSFASYPSGG